MLSTAAMQVTNVTPKKAVCAWQPPLLSKQAPEGQPNPRVHPKASPISVCLVNNCTSGGREGPTSESVTGSGDRFLHERAQGCNLRASGRLCTS